MGALQLDLLSWPEVQREIEGGRATVVIAFGATEQHGPHMPLATDALLGDRLAWLVAEELDAFVAPTVRIGCSEHHLGFPGTLSIGAPTFAAIVGDLLESLRRGGFRRAILLPTHGGNFAPLQAALDAVGAVEGLEVRALTDLTALLAIAQLGEREHGVPLGEGGLHAGEWEASMLAAVHPDLVHLDLGEPGYTGDLQAAIARMFEGGVAAVAPNGVLGDPARASAAHGERYWDEVVRLTLESIAT
jgi:creatinine amidohydrolase